MRWRCSTGRKAASTRSPRARRCGFCQRMSRPALEAALRTDGPKRTETQRFIGDRYDRFLFLVSQLQAAVRSGLVRKEDVQFPLSWYVEKRLCGHKKLLLAYIAVNSAPESAQYSKVSRRGSDVPRASSLRASHAEQNLHRNTPITARCIRLRTDASPPPTGRASPASTAAPQKSTARMATDIQAAIITPATVETRPGTLRFLLVWNTISPVMAAPARRSSSSAGMLTTRCPGFGGERSCAAQ